MEDHSGCEVEKEPGPLRGARRPGRKWGKNEEGQRTRGVDEARMKKNYVVCELEAKGKKQKSTNRVVPILSK